MSDRPKYTIIVRKYDETNEDEYGMAEALPEEDLIVLYEGSEHADAPLHLNYEEDGSVTFYL